MPEPVHISSVVADIQVICPHKRTELRYKLCSNGKKLLCTQCLDCGQRAGKDWLPQDRVNMKEVQPFDAALEEQGAKQQQAIWAAKRERESVQRHLDYERYIQDSDDWQMIRTKVMRRDNYLCQACLEEPATQVHHKSYAHLYDEWMWELVSVCQPCHEKIHGKTKTP